MRWSAIRSRRGFTIIEVVVAAVIAAIAIAASSAAFIFIFRTETQAMHQADLDIGVRRAIRDMKKNMRLTSLNEMLYYPTDGSDLQAVSFPVPAVTNDAAVIDENGAVVWGSTVIYHGWPADNPQEFRETTFSPRDPNHADRQGQLASVVLNGDATGLANASNATTRTIFRNLVNWQIHPISSIYEAYNPVQRRDADVYLGSVILTPGAHDLSFTAVGKADGNVTEQLTLGIDKLALTPSYAPFEAETGVDTVEIYTGTAPCIVEPSAKIYSGHHVMEYTGTTLGDTFTLPFYNDQWQEANFAPLSGAFDQLMTEYRTTGADQIYFASLACPATSDYVVRLRGMTDTWRVGIQTGDATGSSVTNDALEGIAARVLLKGELLLQGINILKPGRRCRVLFAAAGTSPASLSIIEAFIAESEHHGILNPNITSATKRALMFTREGVSTASVSIPAGTTQWSDYVDVAIDPDKTYVVGFLLGKSASESVGAAKIWGTEALNPLPSMYLIPATNAPTSTDLLQADWRVRPDVVSTQVVYAVEQVDVTFATEGSFVSAPIDTGMATPAYQGVRVNATVPTGTALECRVRAGSDPAMSDALDWTNAPVVTAWAGNFDHPLIAAKRYVQFRTAFTSDAATGMLSPLLHDVTLRWLGPERIVDVGGAFVQAPNGGRFEVRVDDIPLKAGVVVELEVYKDVLGMNKQGKSRLTSVLIAEVAPRNTQN